MLRLVRSVKNTFAAINQIPPEVFSLIPDYWQDRHTGQDLITLSHVCRGWREIFTSRSSLWTYLDCADADKTRVYVERSRSLPLEIFLRKSQRISYCDDALPLVVPHISRLSSLTVCVRPNILLDLLNQLPFPAPLLTELKIILDPESPDPDPIIPDTLFPGHLSPLRKLSLSGVFTRLPWRNLSDLTMFEFRYIPQTVDPLFVAQLLDFFESTPLLNRISLHDSIPISFSVPPGRVVPLLHLEELIVHSLPSHSTFLGHLSIPAASLVDLNLISFTDSAPIPACFANNFSNLYHITTIHLFLNGLPYKRMRLMGPNGDLRIFGSWANRNCSPLAAEHQFFRSLRKFDLSKTQRLAVEKYSSPGRGIEKYSFSPGRGIEESPIFQTLLLMKSLRTLLLIEVHNLSFIRALNPKQNKSHTVLCPELEELVLYVKRRDWFCLKELMEMASERTKNVPKLSSITIVSLDGICSKEEVFRLRRYVSHVEYKLDEEPPYWGAVYDASEWDELRLHSEDEDDDWLENY